VYCRRSVGVCREVFRVRVRLYVCEQILQQYFQFERVQKAKRKLAVAYSSCNVTRISIGPPPFLTKGGGALPRTSPRTHYGTAAAGAVPLS